MHDIRVLGSFFQALRTLKDHQGVPETLEVLLDQVEMLRPAAGCAVLLARPASGHWHIIAHRNLDPGWVADFNQHNYPLEHLTIGAKLSEGNLFETQEADVCQQFFGSGHRERPLATFVPFSAQGELVGCLALEGPIANQEERCCLEGLANLVGTNIRLLEMQDSQSRMRSLLETIGQIGGCVSSRLPLNTLLGSIVELVCRNFPFPRVTLYLKGYPSIVASRPSGEVYTPSCEIHLSILPQDEGNINLVLSSLSPDRHALEERDSSHESPLRASLTIPIMLGNHILGALNIELQEPQHIGVAERYAIQALADQIAFAVENSRLLTERERRLTELATLTELGHEISSVLMQKRVAEQLAQGSLKLIPASCAGIFVQGRDGLSLTAFASPDGTDATPLLDQDLARRVFETGQAILNMPGSLDIRMLTIPLMSKGKPIGALQLARMPSLPAFNEDERHLLETLALPGSIALENARLYEETQQRLAEVSTLYTLAQRMSSSLDLSQMLDSMVVILRRVIDCRGCCIFLLNEETGLLEIRAASGLKPRWQQEAKLRVGEGVSGRVVQESRSIYIPDTHQEREFIFFDPEVRSLLAVPMITKGKVIGTLSVDDDRPQAFEAGEGRLLSIAAAHAATLIENARLFEGLKERARRLKLAYDELKELNRLKSEFVQNVSHELRTPLTFVRGYVDLLLDGSLGELSQQQSEALHVISSKTETLTRLVGDIISLQKAEMSTLDLAPVTLSEVVGQAMRGAEASAHEAGLELICEIEPDLPPVLVDRTRLGQVFDNLIGNALKYTPIGGRIEIIVREAGNFVKVWIHDTGIGIPPEKHERVFEPFFQIDGSSTRRFGGAGLGLAIVKQIVEAHGGNVGLTSNVGQGSTFWFTLPKYQPGTVILSSSEKETL